MQRGVLLHKKYNCSKGPGLVAAAAGGNRRVELVCSGCHAVSENGVWVINKPESVEVQTRHRVEDDRDESIRMKCSGKSAAAGHEEREEFKRGERLEQRVRRATALSAIWETSHVVADKAARAFCCSNI